MRKNILENIRAKQERERQEELAEQAEFFAAAKQYLRRHPELWDDVYDHWDRDMNGDRDLG